MTFVNDDCILSADMSKYSAGCIYHFPDLHINSEQIEVKRFQKTFSRYLTRKIGFEAVLRIRCTKGEREGHVGG